MAGVLVDPKSGRGDLHALVTRWVSEGLLDPEQAARIEAAEAQRAARAGRGVEPAGRGEPRAVPLVVEALGYLGGLLAVVAGFISIRQLWPDIPTGAQLGFAGVAAVALFWAGVAVDAARDPAFERLRSVLWFLSTASVTAFMGLLTAQVWDIGTIDAVLISATTVTAYAVLLWLRARLPLQHLAVFGGLATVVVAGTAWLDSDPMPWNGGLSLWVLAACWGIAAYRGLLEPRLAGYIVAAVGLIVGAQMTMQTAAGNLLGVLTVAAVLAAGVLLRQVWLLGIGAYSVIQIVPQVAVRYLPGSVAAPLSLFVVGLVLLVFALWLSRWRRSQPH